MFPGVRARLGGALAVLAVLTGTMSASTVPAHADETWDGACEVTLTITFNGYTVTSSPSFAVDYSVSGQSVGACTSHPAGETMTFTGFGTAEVVSCDAISVQSAIADFNFFPALGSPANSELDTIQGPWGAQHWNFPGVAPIHFDAVGDFTLNGPVNQVENCKNFGATQFNLIGTLVYEDPTVAGT